MGPDRHGAPPPARDGHQAHHPHGTASRHLSTLEPADLSLLSVGHEHEPRGKSRMTDSDEPREHGHAAQPDPRGRPAGGSRRVSADASSCNTQGSALRRPRPPAAAADHGPPLAPTVRRRLQALPEGWSGTIADVKHVVILMQENRSFDHYFGTSREYAASATTRSSPTRTGPTSSSSPTRPAVTSGTCSPTT